MERMEGGTLTLPLLCAQVRHRIALMVTCYIGNESKLCLDAIVPQSVPQSVGHQSFPVEPVEWLWSHLVVP